MRYYHSRIRQDAIALYAATHPTVRLRDIGRALGTYVVNYKRPLGPKSPAYDFAKRTAKMRAYYDSKKFDRNHALALALEGKTFLQIAEIIGCNPEYLCHVMRSEFGMVRVNSRFVKSDDGGNK
jgi:hypothetical protein